MSVGMWIVGAVLCGQVTAETDPWQQVHSRLGDTPALMVVVGGDPVEDRRFLARTCLLTHWTILCQVQGEGASELRAWAREQQLLGSRLSVVDGDGPSLCLASDMADAVWVLPSADTSPPERELMRVLRPGGLFVAQGNVQVKPAQPGTDQWRHPYHGPDNNIVSQDTQARLPGELRFQTHPVFAAMPNQSLFAGGRIFFFTGHIAFHEREEPLLNKLTVLNAYNGLTLWSRELDPRYVVHNFCKVATDREVIYAEGETLRVLDAASGRELGSYAVPQDAQAAGDIDWKWLAQEGDVLWAAFGPPDGRVMPHRQKRQMGHWPWDVADTQYRVIVDNFGAARTLAAFRFPDMELLWSVQEPEAFDVRALCLEGGRIFQLAPEKYLAAREASTGKQLWRQTAGNSDALTAVGTALKRQGWGLGWATFCCARAQDGVVCIAGPPFKQSVCISLEQGRLLWSSENESPHPFFLDDALYVMPRVAQTANCRQVDPLTGQLLNEYDLGMIGSCTRLTVTPAQFFYRPGGGEGRTVYFDLNARQLASYEGVVRPGCFDGVVPANGRLYWMPLACDCWQVHGTFCMAPRQPLLVKPPVEGPVWGSPQTDRAAAEDDWPMLRADARGSATVPVPVPRDVRVLWRRQLSTGDLTAPICVGGRVFVGDGDGSVNGLAGNDGRTLWSAFAQAAVVQPPAYWRGRIVYGSCDGSLYAVDAATGRALGSRQIAPQTRWVNIMNRLVSAWPLGGGVTVDSDGTAYAAAGSTAADGAVVTAIDLSQGKQLWRQIYTLDRADAAPSFGVQSNLLLHGDELLINGGAPVGILALDKRSGALARVAAKLDHGKEMFVEPDGTPFCGGPELFSDEWARTTIFKRHQGRAYFETANRHIALVDGRLFAAADTQTLDAIVAKMNSDPVAGGERVVSQPWNVMQVPVPDSLLWASPIADICGLAVGSDGVVVLHADAVEGLSPAGESLWRVPLSAPPVRWGVALSGELCAVTLTDGHVVALGRADADTLSQR